ncbi:MAG: polymer-forming cytoskeletal protein [Lachnospiraceae bacterium]|nr:polymer-forming cytoskeletal protein [Lachnospiraceae bacterium]
MGFFSDLKEDLSQAVNELKPEGSTADLAEENDISDEDLEKLGDDLDSLFASADEDGINEDQEFDIDFGDKSEPEEKQETIAAPKMDDYVIPTTTFFQPHIPTPEAAPEPEVSEPVMPEMPAMPEMPKAPEAPAPIKVPQVNVAPNRVAQDEVSVIMDSMIINGNMATEGSLEIRGSVVGNVEALGKLNITGNIQGNSSAAEVFAENAKITGDIRSLGAIKVGQSTVIIGNISATSAVIAGAIKGDIDVKGPVILDASAIVMGNIKSKSVQINNGAVIEGMCSQCYAEVNPTSFFEELKKMK